MLELYRANVMHMRRMFLGDCQGKLVSCNDEVAEHRQ